jgi:hypothetical protein
MMCARSSFEFFPLRLQAGFFLIQYAHLWQDHLDKLFDLYASRKLKVCFIVTSYNNELVCPGKQK